MLTFSANEMNELSYYGRAPNNIYFLNKEGKTDWLNHKFMVNINGLVHKAKPVSKTALSKIIYRLPSDVKVDDKLKINIIDNRRRVIDYELQDHKILIDPNYFNHEESFLVLNATYRKRKLKLLKDSSALLKDLERYVEDFFIDALLYKNEVSDNATKHLNQIRKWKDYTVLKGVEITGEKFKINHIGRGQTKTFEELELNKYTTTALSLLPQIGVYTQPNIGDQLDFYNTVIRRHGTILSSKRQAITGGYGFFYEMNLVISGPSGVYYQGHDFTHLSAYRADWVYAITKKNDQPESVYVYVRPGFRGEDSFVVYEKIFSQTEKKTNSGVLLWDFGLHMETDQIRIPMENASDRLNWTLMFFDKNETVMEYSGVYEQVVSK
jgi:hypothetical protein